MMSSRVTVTKKACDGCKVRKVRCGGGSPCRPCVNARVQCTYQRLHERRGPQKLRESTRRLIEQEQHQSPSQHGLDDADELPTDALVSLLYIYHVRMYPVWPIVRVDDLIAALQQADDLETRALATGLAAATIAQLKLGGSSIPAPSITAGMLATKCLEARKAFDYRLRVNLNTIRTAFFLHVYYENQHSGGSESILYLREAITLAQMMYLHREASYAGLTMDEAQLRRRVLWLLVVTERGVCILHKLPVVLKADTEMPTLEEDEEPQVLPAFLKLLSLFKLFEQTRMFDIVEDYHLGLQSTATTSADTNFNDILNDKFGGDSAALNRVSDVQKADICVTSHWMRILTWKALSNWRLAGTSESHWLLSPVFPLAVARDPVSAVHRLPRAALQAHGLGMQLKLHEVANSVADTATDTQLAVQHGNRPSHILGRLHSILSALTDGQDTTMVDILYGKVARAHHLHSKYLPPSLNGPLLSTGNALSDDHGSGTDSERSDDQTWSMPPALQTYASQPVFPPFEQLDMNLLFPLWSITPSDPMNSSLFDLDELN